MEKIETYILEILGNNIWIHICFHISSISNNFHIENAKNGLSRPNPPEIRKNIKNNFHIGKKINECNVKSTFKLENMRSFN